MPSELYGLDDPLAARLFDNAITVCGQSVDHALAERVQVGTKEKPKSQPRYTLAQLLDPAFRLPVPEMVQWQPVNPWQPLLDLVGQPRSGVRAYQYVGPVPARAS